MYFEQTTCECIYIGVPMFEKMLPKAVSLAFEILQPILFGLVVSVITSYCHFPSAPCSNPITGVLLRFYFPLISVLPISFIHIGTYIFSKSIHCQGRLNLFKLSHYFVVQVFVMLCTLSVPSLRFIRKSNSGTAQKLGGGGGGS